MKELLLPDGRTFTWREGGNGAPLILIHGWGSSSAIFAELMTQLPGVQTLALDLPGYGASSPTPTLDLEGLTNDFMTWIDALALPRVTLLGWSFGGILAQYLAAHFPSRIERLILIATTPRFVATTDWPHGLADAAVRALARDFKRAPLLTLENFQTRQFQGEKTIPPPLLPRVETATALNGLQLLRCVDLRPELAKITMPTLVVHGALDLIIPMNAGRFLAATLAQAQLHEVSACGHAPFRSDVAAVSAFLRDFLS